MEITAVCGERGLKGRARHCPLNGHEHHHGAEHLPVRNRDTEPVRANKVDERYEECTEDRQGKKWIRYGDDLEGNERYPDQIEQRCRDGNDFGPEPSQPAENEFSLLITVEQAPARQELPPVLLHDLHRAPSPTRPLSLECQIVLRQQSPAIAAVGVVGTPPELQDRQSEVAILANRVA